MPGHKEGLKEEGVDPTLAGVEKRHRGTEGGTLMLSLEPGRMESGGCSVQRVHEPEHGAEQPGAQGPKEPL